MARKRTGNPRILVTGSKGQLGSEIRVLAAQQPALEFIFLSREDLPINDFTGISEYVKRASADYCINCAAYTAVDRAESEVEAAFLVNGDAVGILAAACFEAGTKFIHISTDYVFNGSGVRPYREEDQVEPINTYGASKLLGEIKAAQYNPDTIIIRTSWVYSTFGNNFVKTMLRLMRERESISVVDDQYGSPTHAADLAKTLLTIISSGRWVPGIYHYSNEGLITWFRFASAIRDIVGSDCLLQAISSDSYATAARRPRYSALDKTKIRTVYQVIIPDWEVSLKACLETMKRDTPW